MDSADISKSGTPIDEVIVKISYQIIDLFSGQLYSSPTKAVEEIIVNSYDAFARECRAFISENWESPNAQIVVFDDGDGMDVNGLQELWLIAETKKRDEDRQAEALQRGRLPIGKFGIGKLASYVVGERISHLTKKNGKYYIVTMDYSTIKNNIEEKLVLPIRELTEEEVKVVLEEIIYEEYGVPDLTSADLASGTIVVIDKLKDRVKQIKKGRLRWVISTALPLDPTFKVYLNEEEISSSKVDFPKHKEWRIGEDDDIAEELGFESFIDNEKEEPFNKGIIIPDLGKVSGITELFKPTITTGKSAEKVGRNNGFFIIARKRLINLDDELFGLNAQSHSTFNRFRGEIYADGLDNFLVADREDVAKEGHQLLNEYLKRKFSEARNFYDTIRQIEDEIWPEALDNIPGDLVRYPLKRALERADNEGFSTWLIHRPVEETEEYTSINEIQLQDLQTLDPVGIYETETGTVKANTLHPFRSNFPNDDSYKNWAAIEALTEAYLIDVGLDIEKVKSILEKRDRLMRTLVRLVPRTATVIAQNILDTISDENAFEIACERGFRILGFDVTRLGKSGRPDGIVSAPLGVGVERDSRAYTFVYDSKTSIHEKVKASNLNQSSLKRHRGKYGADYSILIAPDYEGEGEESAAVIEAIEEENTLMKAKDFARLIEVSATRPLSMSKFEEIFKQGKSYDDVAEWIDEFIQEEPSLPPIKDILDTIWQIQRDDTVDPASFGVIRYKLEIEKSSSEIKHWLDAIKRLVPDLINISGEHVELNQSPEVTCEQIRVALDNMRDKKIGIPLKESLE